MEQQATSAKLYSRIGEVARLTGLKPSVLRFWETEFPEIAPQKSQTGQRLYSRSAIATVIKIKELLYKEKLTIAGARTRLRQGGSARVEENIPSAARQVILTELQEIRKLLLQ
jgi:DNA-binding transcriptional MerR regulator